MAADRAPGLMAIEYHRATRHDRSAGGTTSRRIDPTSRPRPFKRYPGAESIALPRDLPAGEEPAASVLSRGGHGSEPRLDLGGLARLLFFSAGVTRHVAGIAMRAAPSAGALYPIELYLACGEVEGLEPGIYHFDPLAFALHRLRAGDQRGHLAAATALELASTPASLLLTGIPWRTLWRYGARGYRHLFWDAGTILANLLALTDAVGLPAHVLTAFCDAALSRLLGLDQPGALEEYPLAVVALGRPRAHAAAPLGPMPPPGPSAEPPFGRPVAEPLVTATHRSGDLDRLDEVERWRGLARALPSFSATVHVSRPTTHLPLPLEEVILRRGSTRRFAPVEVPAQALTWVLAAATRPVPGDFVAPGRTLLEHHLTVHAVAGFAPGAYRWSSEGPVLLRPGDLRDDAARACLAQAAGGDSAYTVFHGRRLEALLEALGERGYRAAQLEAGIVAGRLVLAAHALGLGGTCLTFYDDEVERLFGTRAATMLATACGVPLRPPRPGRRPPPEGYGP
ncbi:MAG TPA: SagB family peptide dehydrogenase [Candidatus Dormibacteraeota bacterium]|nr:SagB family peptide dehydrogenase [Candidatus Dormibacteraeota bacterium]